MRSAQFICTVDIGGVINCLRECGIDINAIEREVGSEGEGTIISSAVLTGTASGIITRTLFVRPPKYASPPGIFSCKYAFPHVNEAPFDYTVGLVLAGDHMLFTGRGRRVCDLAPGTIYMLNNKRYHGTMPLGDSNLVLALIDFKAASMRDAMTYVAT